MCLDSGIRAAIAVISADIKALKARPTGGSGVPTLAASAATFSVPADTQALFTIDIDVQGVVDVAGILVEV